MWQFQSFLDLMWHLLMVECGEEEKLSIVVTIVWALWFNQNEVRHGRIKKSGLPFMQWAFTVLGSNDGAITWS